jgi:cbb3-type cytochrome oxidase subunit 1
MMLWFSTAFLKASLAWLGLGVTLGVAMAAYPAWSIYRAAHLHMLVLGFVAMMIFGVAYHVVPRFTSHPLHSPRAAGVQWWAANLGLIGMVVGFAVRANGSTWGTTVLASGGLLSAISAYLFIWNTWRTIDGPRGAPVAPRPDAPTPLAPLTSRITRPA